MLVGLYSAATGLEAAERMHEVIAENLAHVSVPGFRANVLSQETFEQAFQQQLSHPSPEGHGSHVTQVSTDFTPGPTSTTGRKLDVALSGEGFFEVQGPDESLYTRNGVFFLNQENQLVNSQGMEILGTGGPIQMPGGFSSESINIAADGSLSVNGNTFGQLRRVTFADNSRLERAGTTLFRAPADVQPEEATTQVMQGARELANVSAVNEMVRMIVGTRHYEAAQKALQTLDQAVGQVTDPRS